MSDIAVEEARARILAGCAPLAAHAVALEDAAGCVLAQDVLAPHALPPFRNAGMDGFAVHAADLAAASDTAPVTLPVAGSVQAGGTLIAQVAAGTAVRIMTGAPVPDGADAVIPIEDTRHADDNAVVFVRPIAPQRNVRPVGEDVPAGVVAIPAGQVVRAAEVGLLAALGIEQVAVVRVPHVGIISTGDELLAPHEPLAPGKIRDANSLALAVAVRGYGATAQRYGIARDTHAALRAKIEQAVADGCDLIITSAGASAGDYDVVSSLMREGDHLAVWRVNLKPGRPLLYGQFQGVPLVGLPGNPASALIVAELFVRPAVERLRGMPERDLPTVRAITTSPLKGSSRRHYVRARLERTGHTYQATTDGIGSGSGSLSTLVRANGLLIIPEGTGDVPAGSEVEALLL